MPPRLASSALMIHTSGYHVRSDCWKGILSLRQTLYSIHKQYHICMVRRRVFDTEYKIRHTQSTVFAVAELQRTKKKRKRKNERRGAPRELSGGFLFFSEKGVSSPLTAVHPYLFVLTWFVPLSVPHNLDVIRSKTHQRGKYHVDLPSAFGNK